MPVNMANPVTISVSLQWTPPGAAANSGLSSFGTTATYNAQNVGEIDVQPTATPATVIPISFGAVSAAKMIMIRNMTSAEVGVRLNGAVADTLSLPAGSCISFSSATTPVGTPLTSASIVLTTPSVTTIEKVYYYVFGD